MPSTRSTRGSSAHSDPRNYRDYDDRSRDFHSGRYTDGYDDDSYGGSRGYDRQESRNYSSSVDGRGSTRNHDTTRDPAGGRRRSRDYSSRDGRSSLDYNATRDSRRRRSSRESKSHHHHHHHHHESDDDDDANSKHSQRELTTHTGKGVKKFIPPDPRSSKTDHEARQHRLQKEKECHGFDWTPGIVLGLIGATALFSVDRSLVRRKKKDVLDEWGL